MKTELYNLVFIIQNPKHVGLIEEMVVWHNFLVMFSSHNSKNFSLSDKIGNKILEFSNHEIWVSVPKVLILLDFNLFLFHFQTTQATLYFISFHFLLCFSSFNFYFIREFLSGVPNSKIFGI